MNRKKITAVCVIISAAALLIFSITRIYGVLKSYTDDVNAYSALASAAATRQVPDFLADILEKKTETVQTFAPPAKTGVKTAHVSAAPSSAPSNGLPGFLADIIYKGNSQTSVPEAAATPALSETPMQIAESKPFQATPSLANDSADNNTADTIDIPEKQIDFTSLLNLNPEVAGWIEIPGTTLNYPLMQAPDNEYYLTHRFDNQDSKSGAIFIDSAASKDMTDSNTFVFGHNMKNGTMFAMLHNYADPAFYESHPYIFIYLPDGSARAYKIFSAHKVSAESDEYMGGVWNETLSLDYAQKAAAHSMYKTGYSPVEGSPLIALSTCVRGESENRFIIHAQQVGASN